MFTYKILITGSRNWPSSTFIFDTLLDLVSRAEKEFEYYGSVQFILIHGNAIGADIQSANAARDLKKLGFDIEIESYPANWTKFGKRAGYIRNKEMVDLHPDVCLAFILDESRGATMCANLAEDAKIPTRRYTLSSQEEPEVDTETEV